MKEKIAFYILVTISMLFGIESLCWFGAVDLGGPMLLCYAMTACWGIPAIAIFAFAYHRYDWLSWIEEEDRDEV